VGKWNYSTVGEINNYKGKSINPLNTPETTYELYSVPSWDNNYPEIITGSEIGSTKQIVEKDDVLLCKINPRINRVWVVEQYTELPLIASSEWIIVRNKNIDSRFLKKYFQSPIFRDMMVSEQSGIGGSLTRAQPKRVSAYPVPLPPLPTQKQIADVLDRASALIEKRKAQIERLELLIKSQFIEMFGDPVINPKGWEMSTVGKEVIFEGGAQPDKKWFEYQSTKDNVRLIQIRDYKTDSYLTYIPKDKARRFCDASDIMIGRYGPPIFQILKGIEGAYNVALIKATPVRCKKDYARQFLMQDTLFKYIEGLSQRTAGQTGIDMPKLKAYPFPIPPIPLQNSFAAFVERVETQKALLQRSLEKLELNYKSLMQKCFRGEIF